MPNYKIFNWVKTYYLLINSGNFTYNNYCNYNFYIFLCVYIESMDTRSHMTRTYAKTKLSATMLYFLYP